jgi:hypothetical protein
MFFPAPQCGAEVKVVLLGQVPVPAPRLVPRSLGEAGSSKSEVVKWCG